MFAYEYSASSSSASSSSSSSSSSSPPPLRHRLRRKPSHVPSRPYSPSSREADVARLLDPAYASPAHTSPLVKPKALLKEVYVDHHGDPHDPDYRDFPLFGHPRRPQWERGYQLDEDDEDDEEEREPPRPRSSFDFPRRRPSSTITYHPPPIYYPYEEPASYESHFLADEPEEADQFDRTPLKEKPFCPRSRSPAKRQSGQDEKHLSASPGAQAIHGDSDWTPTCTQNLRRHWQAITLSLRFSLFRTKRRLRRRLTG